MSEMNELQRSVGRIESLVKTQGDMLKEVRDYQLKMNGSIGKAHDRIDDIEPHVQDYRETKKKAVIGLLSIGGLTGVIGGKIGSFLSGWLS